MPKVAPEQLEKRREEILDAGEKIYRAHGFLGVTIKQISTELTCTRPAIYRYFETKEEILLALLVREYGRWLESLRKIEPDAGRCSKEELAHAIAKTLESRDLMLRILHMNLYEIEQNSRVEAVSEFKTMYSRLGERLSGILQRYSPAIGEREIRSLIMSLISFLFGVYSFVFSSEKQRAAVQMAGIEMPDITIHEMVFRFLCCILPEKDS